MEYKALGHLAQPRRDSGCFGQHCQPGYYKSHQWCCLAKAGSWPALLVPIFSDTVLHPRSDQQQSSSEAGGYRVLHAAPTPIPLPLIGKWPMGAGAVAPLGESHMQLPVHLHLRVRPAAGCFWGAAWFVMPGEAGGLH